MDIKFNNNIEIKEKAIIIVITKASDIANSIKFPKSINNLYVYLKKISKLLKNYEKEKISKLDLVIDNKIFNIIILISNDKSKYQSYLDGSKLYEYISNHKIFKANILISRNILKKKNNYVSDMLTGCAIRSYKFDKYFTEEKNKKINISLNVFKDTKYSNKFKYDYNLIASTTEAKNLVAEPANILFPLSYANRCMKLKKYGLNIKILDDKQIKKIGMNAITAVGQGSVKTPRVVIFEWKLNKNSKPTILVGKGVTFDTGGISIKPSRGMQEMIMDMGGSAVVVGAMMNAALNKLNKPLVGIIGLVENMPDANAQRPGDIVTTLSGKTVEVLNTDAEGRLVLCDLITYVQKKYKPKNIIDFATLTGSIQAALGPHMAGLFSNNEDLAKNLIKSGSIVGEKLWRMPLGEEYDREIDGSRADISNIGRTPYGGAQTAAEFLHRFIENNIPWAHLDIAGVTWNNYNKGINSKGPTGFSINLISEFLKTKK